MPRKYGGHIKDLVTGEWFLLGGLARDKKGRAKGLAFTPKLYKQIKDKINLEHPFKFYYNYNIARQRNRELIRKRMAQVEGRFDRLLELQRQYDRYEDLPPARAIKTGFIKLGPITEKIVTQYQKAGRTIKPVQVFRSFVTNLSNFDVFKEVQKWQTQEHAQRTNRK